MATTQKDKKAMDSKLVVTKHTGISIGLASVFLGLAIYSVTTITTIQRDFQNHLDNYEKIEDTIKEFEKKFITKEVLNLKLDLILEKLDDLEKKIKAPTAPFSLSE